MKRIMLLSIATVSIVVTMNYRALAGPVWGEITHGGGDAGRLPTIAQNTTGAGPLNGISGQLQGGNDHEDMYRIMITDPVNFSIQTDTVQAFGTSSFDTQVWLFDETGHALLSNDNEFGAVGGGSFLHAPATDPTGQIIPGVGIYYIAITGSGNMALSAGGPMFSFLNPDEISGPDGVGGGLPIIDWTGAGPTGTYIMTLTGASFASAPAPGALSLLMVAGFGATPGRRRRRFS